MYVIALAAALLASMLSIVSLSRIAIQRHDHDQPRTLSELAASQEQLLNHFRRILFVCGTLFAVAVYGYVTPNIGHPLSMAAAWSVTYFSELALAVIPAKGNTSKAHALFAYIMAYGMLAIAYIGFFELSAGFKIAELVLSVAMSGLALLAIVNRRRFIFYELPFVFMSHAAIVLAILAVR